ncbi:hypothetical protein [Streptomyces narbonensis]
MPTTTWKSTSLLPDILASWWAAAPSSTAASLHLQLRRHPPDGDRQRGRSAGSAASGTTPGLRVVRELRRRGLPEDLPGPAASCSHQ